MAIIRLLLPLKTEVIVLSFGVLLGEVILLLMEEELIRKERCIYRVEKYCIYMLDRVQLLLKEDEMGEDKDT
jgi:hypothetical protein